MKVRIMSIFTGIINGGLLRVAPLYLYRYILSINLNKEGGTDIALKWVLGTLIASLAINIVILVLIYKFNNKESLNIYAFLYVLLGWIITTLILDLTLWSSEIFAEGQYGENIEGAFVVLLSIINFVTILLATIIAKLITKMNKHRATV